MAWAEELLQQHYPWALLLGLLILAVALIAAVRRFARASRSRQVPELRLRSKEAQAQFRTVDTVYSPKRWRKPR